MKYAEQIHFSLLMLVFVELTLLRDALADGPPRISASEAHKFITFVNVNETVTLKCPIETSSEFKTFVDWTKGNISLYMTQGYEITPKGFLKIKTVSSLNSGIYTCEAVNGYGAVRVNLTLVVINPEIENKNVTLSNRNSANKVHTIPPTITKRPSSFTAELGAEAHFHCIASGQPLPRIFWIKDGYLVEGSNSYISKRKTHSTLKVNGLKKSDAGQYKCLAKNTAGEDELDFFLHVIEQSPPPKIIALDPPNVIVREGESIVFVCEVASRPGVHLHIKWLKKQEGSIESLGPNDNNLFRSGKLYYRPLNLTNSDFIIHGSIHKSKLFIRNSLETDSGTYVCLALNDKGFNFKNSTLKVIGKTHYSANQSYFPSHNIPLAVTITVLFVVTLAVIMFVCHKCCKCRPDEKNMIVATANVESGNLKQSMTSVRKPVNGEIINYPENGEPSSASKLLAIENSFLYEHSESQISKSAHTRTSFH